MKENEEIDDKRTIAKMNVEGMPWYYKKSFHETKNKEAEPVKLTKKEILAMTLGMYSVLIPIVIVYITVFVTLLVLLQKFWLKF